MTTEFHSTIGAWGMLSNHANKTSPDSPANEVATFYRSKVLDLRSRRPAQVARGTRNWMFTYTPSKRRTALREAEAVYWKHYGNTFNARHHESDSTPNAELTSPLYRAADVAEKYHNQISKELHEFTQLMQQRGKLTQGNRA